MGASESCVAAAAAVVVVVVGVVEVVVVVRDVFGLVRGCCNRQMSVTVTRKGGGDEGETAKLQIMTMAFVVFRCPFPLQGYVCSYVVSPSKKDHD